MPYTQLSAHRKLAQGETIEFCPTTQSWWPKGLAPAGAQVTVAALLNAPAVYEAVVGMRTRDIRFTPLADEADTMLASEVKDY